MTLHPETLVTYRRTRLFYERMGFELARRPPGSCYVIVRPLACYLEPLAMPGGIMVGDRIDSDVCREAFGMAAILQRPPSPPASAFAADEPDAVVTDVLELEEGILTSVNERAGWHRSDGCAAAPARPGQNVPTTFSSCR
jgi:hypothetical protein